MYCKYIIDKVFQINVVANVYTCKFEEGLSNQMHKKSSKFSKCPLKNAQSAVFFFLY